MKICGLHAGHDCSFAVLNEGRPEIHLELERFIRKKEPKDDAYKFFQEKYADHQNVFYYAHTLDIWEQTYKSSYDSMMSHIKGKGEYLIPGHHESHAANAFFSSNFDQALIITIDGGGRDYVDKNHVVTAFTAWEGVGNKVYPIEILKEQQSNIGYTWRNFTEWSFGLSTGYPKGSQMGTIMAMAAFGDPKYKDDIATMVRNFELGCQPNQKFALYRSIVEKSEQDKFDVAASLQVATEEVIRDMIQGYLDKKPDLKNICFSGGVVLNSLMMGKMWDWFKGRVEDMYVCPVPYDSGLAIGAAQWLWHQHLDNPRIKWEDNFTPYLGIPHDQDEVLDTLIRFSDKVNYDFVSDIDVLGLLAEQKIVSVFGGGSESGRRALGNRSILADPRNPDMKSIINEKVKHRQWFRPFAPSILREEVGNYFEHDVDSPYMTYCLKFRDEVQSKVPAVVHKDGTARLQTVTENDNKRYYDLLKKWNDLTGCPILLNTSFNDTEPIVETPEHGINCFLGTNIDHLFFQDHNILVSKK